MNERFVLIISASAIFNLSLIAILSWFKSKNKPAYFWLGWMFFASAMAILDNTLILDGEGSILFYHLGLFLNLSWGGYIISFTNGLRHSNRQVVVFDWRLFIPSFLYFPFLFLCLYQPHWATDTIKLAEAGKMTIFGKIYNIIICVYSVASNAVLYLQQITKKRKLKLSKAQNLKIKEFLLVMLILQVMAFLPFVLKFNLNYILLYMPVFGQLFFLYIFFRLSYSTQLFYEYEPGLKLRIESSRKYAAIKMDENKADEIKTRIIRLMENEKPYLKMEYALSEMAKELNILPGTLSMIINSKLNSSFPDYINSLRIKAALRLLADFYTKNLTIETVAYECGFNNRTSFYKAFKKQTGKLPSDYLVKRSELKKVVS